jgi:hypothetical protein
MQSSSLGISNSGLNSPFAINHFAFCFNCYPPPANPDEIRATGRSQFLPPIRARFAKGDTAEAQRSQTTPLIPPNKGGIKGGCYSSVRSVSLWQGSLSIFRKFIPHSFNNNQSKGGDRTSLRVIGYRI